MSINVEQWDDVLGDLYGAVLDPARLQRAVSKADRLLGSDLCHIVGISNQGAETFRLLSQAGTQAVGDLYAAHYNRIDPRRLYIQQAQVGRTHRCSEFFDARFVSRDPFYQDFLIPEGFRYVIGACLHRSANEQVFVAFNHGAGRDDFTDHEQRFFERYISHLGRAMGSVFAHAPLAAALASEGALQALEVGVMALDQHARMIYCNRQADGLLGSALRQQFSAGTLAEGGALAALFRRVQRDGHAPTVALRAGPGMAPMFVSGMRIRPDPQDDGGAFDAYLGRLQPAVVLVFSLGKNRAVLPPSELMQIFGLSAAEARLAHALGGGMSVQDFAALYSVSVATVRTQLRAVLYKTGEARQQDLVRMLIALPRNAAESARSAANHPL
ncbi:helix-turn-helix transcriptional regulator [Massilia sp. PWRC2]|uniref:helix-turn-helix transcriptional regulator n=1 Tax=Massilia sp. PWRC2 TaxID=2804626 RepID=UPI003CEC11C0